MDAARGEVRGPGAAAAAAAAADARCVPAWRIPIWRPAASAAFSMTETMVRTPDRPIISKRVWSGEREAGPSYKELKTQDETTQGDQDDNASAGDSSDQGSAGSDGLLWEAGRDAREGHEGAGGGDMRLDSGGMRTLCPGMFCVDFPECCSTRENHSYTQDVRSDARVSDGTPGGGGRLYRKSQSSRLEKGNRWGGTKLIDREPVMHVVPASPRIQ